MQVQAFGPGLEKTGCVVNQSTEFTVDAKDAGKGPLNIMAQVGRRSHMFMCGMNVDRDGQWGVHHEQHTHRTGFTKHAVGTERCHDSLSSCQDAEGLPVEVKLTSSGDGLYSCSYTPTSALKHTVVVAWGGVNIPSSPFRVSPPSQPCLTKRSESSTASNAPVEAQSAALVHSESAVVVENTKTMYREQSVNTKSKSKPLIIIFTYTEEKFSS